MTTTPYEPVKHTPVSVLAVAQDARFRKLFALAGRACDELQAHDPEIADVLQDALLDVAPEYVPPMDDNDELRAEWAELVLRESSIRRAVSRG